MTKIKTSDQDNIYYVISTTRWSIVHEAPTWEIAETYRLTLTCPEHYGVVSNEVYYKEETRR